MHAAQETRLLHYLSYAPRMYWFLVHARHPIHEDRCHAAPALGLIENGSLASRTVKPILNAIDEAVARERQNRGGDSISEAQTRHLVIGAVMNHNSFRRHKQSSGPAGGSTAGSSTDRESTATCSSAIREMNNFLSQPQVVASTDGSKARRILVA